MFISESAKCHVDLTFIIDSSGSINFADDSRWNMLREFVVNVTSQLEIGPDATQVAVVRFSNRSQIVVPFSRDQQKTTLLHTVRHMSYSGGRTNLNDALNRTWSEVYADGSGARPFASDLAIIITDGEDNVPTINSPLTIQNAVRCRQNGIRLIAVGITETISPERLLRIVSSPGDLYNVSDFDVLWKMTPILRQQICPPSTHWAAGWLNEF